MTFTALVIDGKNGTRSYIHAPSCRLILNARGRTHAHALPPFATAEAAAEQWDTDNDHEERGIPKTVVCRCARTAKRAIRCNQYGNWNGYEGGRKVTTFGFNESAANEWAAGAD